MFDRISKTSLKIQKQPQDLFYKRGALKNFAKFAGKHLCRSLFFNKVAGLRHAILLKKRRRHWCFPVFQEPAVTFYGHSKQAAGAQNIKMYLLWLSTSSASLFSILIQRPMLLSQQKYFLEKYF